MCGKQSDRDGAVCISLNVKNVLHGAWVQNCEIQYPLRGRLLSSGVRVAMQCRTCLCRIPFLACFVLNLSTFFRGLTRDVARDVLPFLVRMGMWTACSGKREAYGYLLLALQGGWHA